MLKEQWEYWPSYLSRNEIHLLNSKIREIRKIKKLIKIFIIVYRCRYLKVVWTFRIFILPTKEFTIMIQIGPCVLDAKRTGRQGPIIARYARDASGN